MSELGYPDGQSGALVKTDQATATGDHIQAMKPGYSSPSSEVVIQADAAGVLAKVSGLTQPLPITDNAGQPIAVRVSDGNASVDTLPINIGNAILPVSGGLTITGAANVDGDALLMNQGAAGSAWPITVTDGANILHLTQETAGYAVDLNPVQAASANAIDKTPFQEAQSSVGVVAGVRDNPGSTLTEDTETFLRLTHSSAVHAQLHRADGAEIAIAARSLPVSLIIPHAFLWARSYGFIGGTLNYPLYTPPPGYTVFMQGWNLTMRTAGIVTLSEGISGQGGVNLPAPTDDRIIYRGKPGVGQFSVNYYIPVPLTVHDNYIRLDSDSVAAGDIFIWGFYR